MSDNTSDFLGTGRRKTAVARVRVNVGSGNITVNGRPYAEYFPLEQLRHVVTQPLTCTETLSKYDVFVNVRGGGLTGQAEATRHGIARALLEVDTAFRPLLKAEGFLTRDPRMKERKKIRSARSPQALPVQQALNQALHFPQLRSRQPRVIPGFFVAPIANRRPDSLQTWNPSPSPANTLDLYLEHRSDFVLK